MNAADELERMADEFQGRFDTCVGHARDVGDRSAEYGVFMAKADAFLEVETALRVRARGLRAAKRGGTEAKQ